MYHFDSAKKDYISKIRVQIVLSTITPSFSLLKRVSSAFAPGLSLPDKTFHVFNDNLNNGKENQRPLRGGSDSLEVKLKDIVAVEMQCITRPTYLYYYSLNQQSGAGPGGGTTPANPPSNIIGGALGKFFAHTVQRRQVQIK